MPFIRAWLCNYTMNTLIITGLWSFIFSNPGRSFRPPEPVQTGRILAGNDRKRPELTGTDRFRHVPCNRIPAGFRRENSDDFPVGTDRNKLELVWRKYRPESGCREHGGT